MISANLARYRRVVGVSGYPLRGCAPAEPHAVSPGTKIIFKTSYFPVFLSDVRERHFLQYIKKHLTRIYKTNFPCIQNPLK